MKGEGKWKLGGVDKGRLGGGWEGEKKAGKRDYYRMFQGRERGNKRGQRN